MHVSIVHCNWQYACLNVNKLSKFTGVAKSVLGLELRPCDTEAHVAFDRNTAPMRIGHVDSRGKSDIKPASNRHMAFVIDLL